MERHDAKRALNRFVGLTMIRKLKVMAFALLFLPILNSNAEMHSDASSNLDYPSVDAIAKFKVQLSTWRERPGAYGRFGDKT